MPDLRNKKQMQIYKNRIIKIIMFLYKKETLHYRYNIEWENILLKYLYDKELIIRSHEELQKINRKIEKNQLKRNNRSNWTFSKR